MFGKPCGCVWNEWVNPMTGERETFVSECRKHDSNNPASKFLNNSTHWIHDANGRQIRVIYGHTEELLDGLYELLSK